MEDNNAERLMNTLISKMESMDRDIQEVRAENALLRKALERPESLLKKAGFVPYSSPLSEDVAVDAFRGDFDTNTILKEEKDYTNEQIHEMSWNEIHEMADQHREVKELY